MQYHYDIATTKFGNFFLLDSKQGLHFILKNTDKRIPRIKKGYKPQKKLFNQINLDNFINSSLGKEISKKQKIKFLVGTPLQKNVWTYLQGIPMGQTLSYSDLAEKVFKKSAVRAVASAVGKNPIGILIPCHRIICKDGSLGGYAWGLKIKRELLDIEVSGMADSIYRGGK
ncbi:MGMT family protein [Alphaproteobacteria bacterium]|nr:MGMT family protein [Alphaproteobacteria bacterium]